MKTVAALFIIALVVGVASAQSKPSGEESLYPKIQTFLNYQRDLNALVETQKNNYNFDELRHLINLQQEAVSTMTYLDAAQALLDVYDMVSCAPDRAKIRPMVKLQLSIYRRLMDSEMKQVNVVLSATHAQATAATATRMKDDMRDVKARFEAIEASLK